MSDVAGPKQGLMNIGEESKPPQVILPDPVSLFKSRAKRLTKIAEAHELEPYLRFLAQVAEAQAHAAAKAIATAVLPRNARPPHAADVTTPPLSVHKENAGEAAAATLHDVFEHLAHTDLPPQTAEVLSTLRAMPPAPLAAIVASVLADTPPQGDLAARVLVAAGLQVHFATFAAALDADRLTPISDGACPACACAPSASAVVGLAKANNTRFCTCSLCSTMWNVVRVKCVLCSTTAGISYRVIEGKSAAIKAECCEACHAYVKIFYQVDDPQLEVVADDVASLGLDLLLAEEGWRRGGRNPFLTGY